MGTIVVGYVPKTEGRAAVDRAIDEARLRKSRVIVVNSNKGGRELTAAQNADIQQRLDEIKAAMKDAGIDHEIRHFVRGLDPAEDLIAVADEEDAELIVIGLRRRTPVGKLILGSNAQHILLDATCPVLAVKAT